MAKRSPILSDADAEYYADAVKHLADKIDQKGKQECGHIPFIHTYQVAAIIIAGHVIAQEIESAHRRPSPG